ncbi:MAG: pilus assembly protein N-terminal domain-containing protein [Desulfobacterales bacterium]|nr:pilus assembly protein N-terminal domain-containing protein [Desulfobacterales bacterium]
MQNKNSLKTVIWLLAGLMTGLIFTAPVSAKLILTLGEQKTIESPDVKRIAVGDPNIADVKALEASNKILVTAMGVGRTNLLIWDEDDNEKSILIQVIAEDPEDVAEEIRNLLRGIEGIKVMAMGNRIIINGNVLKNQDLNKINKVAALYPQATNLARMSPSVLKILSDKINKEFSEAGLADIKAKRMADKIVIQGDVSDKISKERAGQIATAFDVPVINFIDVGVSLKKMIVVHVDFIELKKGDMNKLGIQWSDASSGVLATASVLGEGGFGELSAPFAGTYGFNTYRTVITAVKNDANSRVLAQPKLLCRSGEKAEFMAGGEVSIPLITEDEVKVEYKPYGLLLNISPVIDKEDHIATEISVEQSTVSYASTSEYPNFDKSRVNTFINVKSGETIVLSGLLSNTNAKSVSKLPGLGDIPVLGELFKSRSFKNDKSELIVFVTPRVTDAKDPEMQDQIEKAEKKYKEADEDLGFDLMD